MIVDLLSTDEGSDIEFKPEPLDLTTRTPELVRPDDGGVAVVDGGDLGDLYPLGVLRR